MRKSTKKRKLTSWKSIGAALGIIVSLIAIGDASFKVWTWINRPLLDASYVAMAGECLDRFMTSKPSGIDMISKSEFGPNMGLNPVLLSAYSDLDTRGATVSSAVFLVLKNVSGEQVRRLDVATSAGESSAFHVNAEQQLLICVHLIYKTKQSIDLSISKITFQTGQGRTHAMVMEAPNDAAFAREAPGTDCVTFGSVPVRIVANH